MPSFSFCGRPQNPKYVRIWNDGITMVEELKIAEAYESMYSQGGEIDEGVSAILQGVKKAAPALIRGAGKLTAKSKPLLTKAVKGASKNGTKGVQAVKKAGSARGAVTKAAKAGLKGVKSKPVQKIAGVAGRFAAKHPIITKVLTRVVWPGFMFLLGSAKSLVVGAVEKAAQLRRTIDNIVTGYGTKRLTSFLGEAEGGNEDSELERFSNFAKEQLSPQEREAFLELYTKTMEIEGTPVDLSELTEENKDSIIGSILISLTKGISSNDGEKAVHDKIMANIEGVGNDGGSSSSDGNGASGGDNKDSEANGGQNGENGGEADADGNVDGDSEDGGSGLTADEMKQLKSMFKAAGI